MAKQIKATDIFESEDIFRGIRQSAEQAIDTLGKFKNELKQTADELKKTIGASTLTDTKSINEFIAATNKANTAKEQAIRIEQEQERLRKLAIQSEREELRYKKELKTAADKEAKAKEKVARETAKQNSAYSQESARLNELRKRYKDLAVQNKENTAEARKLLNEIGALDTKLKRIDATVGQHQRNVGNYKSALGGLNNVLAAFGVGFGVSQVKNFIQESVKLSQIQEKAVAQVAAGLESTGGAVGYTLDELKAKASGFQQETLFGDEQILTDLTAVMLTFTNVTGDAFDRAQQAALDLSTRMGGDLKGAAVQLGKALNDPVKGVTALRKVGVSFTEEQQAQIKTLTESGKLYQAQTIILDEMNKEFAGSAAAAAQADGGITQLQNAFGDAREELGKMVIEGLQPVIQGLKEFFSNLTSEDIRGFVHTLGTIATVIGKVVLAWGAYKTVSLALQAIDKARMFSFKQFGQQMMSQIPLTKQYTAAQKESAAAAQASGQSAKAAGSAMSAVPWIAIIGLLIEVAKGWYDIASGAADARAKTKLYDDYKNAASEQATENINKETEALDKQLKSLDRQREIALSKAKSDKERNAIELKYAKLRKDEVADTQKLLTQYKNANVQRQIGYKQQREELSNLYRLRAERKATSADLKRIFEIENELGARVSESDAANATKALNILGAKIRATNVKIAEYSKAISDSNEMLKDQNKEVEVNTNNQEDNSKKISAKIPKQKEEEKYIRKTTEALKLESEARESLFDTEETERLLLLDEERAVLAADIAVLEAEIALKRLEGSKDANAIQQAEKALFDARKKQIEEQLKLDLAQTDNVNEQLKLQKEAELAIANLSNKETEVVKMNVEKRNEWVKFATDYFIEQSNKRIEQLDKEIAAAEKQQDTLRELAANGNINARESLAENQRIIDEANRKKAQEERRKQMIELVSGVYQTYNQKVAAGSDNALMETIRDTVLLQQFANTLLGNMPTFFDGTEDTGKHGEGVDGKGGFHAILHPNERVVPKSLNEKIGSLSNEQLAKVAQEYQNGKLIAGTQPMSALDLSLLVNKMDELAHVIKNKPETNIELGEITSSVMEIVKTTKQGNTLKTNRFKIRK